MMIRKVIVVSFSLLMLPPLSLAQCADSTSPECSQVKSIDARQDENAPADRNTFDNLDTNDKTVRPAAATDPAPSSRKHKRRSQYQSPRYETADPRDTVLSSEICVYSSATYTYTCR